MAVRKYVFSALIAVFLFAAFAPSVHAHCPLCTGAIGAAAVSAKYYGVDLSVIGMLIGAFGVSTGLWAAKSIKKQVIKHQMSIVAFLSFLFTIIPLRFISGENVYIPLLLIGEPGSMLNKVYWVNKIIFGGVIGGFAALLAFWLHIYIKRAYGRALFPFQGTAITLALLIISASGLYLAFGV